MPCQMMAEVPRNGISMESGPHMYTVRKRSNLPVFNLEITAML